MAFQSRRRWAGHWPVGTDLVAKAPPDGDTMLRKVPRIKKANRMAVHVTCLLLLAWRLLLRPLRLLLLQGLA